MKYKALFVFFFGIVLSLIVVKIGFAKVIKTPVIEGRVIDATTGNPIENVIVSCTWWARVAVPADWRSEELFKETVITDKDGNFKISSKKTWELSGLFRSFNGLDISITHPLYESKSSLNDQQMNLLGDNYNSLTRKADKNNIVKMNISLLSLEEKFREKPWCFRYKSSLHEDLRTGGYEYYFATWRDYKIVVDIDSIFNSIKHLIENYNENKLWEYWQQDIKGNGIYKNWSKETFSANFSAAHLLNELNKSWKISKEVYKLNNKEFEKTYPSKDDGFKQRNML